MHDGSYRALIRQGMSDYHLNVSNTWYLFEKCFDLHDYGRGWSGRGPHANLVSECLGFGYLKLK